MSNPRHDDNDFGQSAETLSRLSSGYTETKWKGGEQVTVEKDTIFSYTFDFLKDAGTWSEAVGKLIGLVN
ncbi:hypothetical protein NYP18_08385 [Corynebacterium sp. YIM 101645]|uniref:Uncharacterized protein n=1 Tax=Corynebacterium lemuris TaxID=1859292 RepID=A0ABT2G0H4_9CORY|nr:hypothetical protein [Corynebacterium lemuris]MCS5479674.1 hypothetical protein [Corynebacterium lemuris]